MPGVPRDLAATNLRSLLRQLRRQLGVSSQAPGLLEHTRTTLALHQGPTDWWDVAEFRAWLAEGVWWQRAGGGDEHRGGLSPLCRPTLARPRPHRDLPTMK
jgi:hypothetical protein